MTPSSAGDGTANRPLLKWERVAEVLGQVFPKDPDLVQDTLAYLIVKFGVVGCPKPLTFAKRTALFLRYNRERGEARRMRLEDEWQIATATPRSSPEEIAAAKEAARKLPARLVKATLFGYTVEERLAVKSARLRARRAGLLAPSGRRRLAVPPGGQVPQGPASLESTRG